MPRETVSDHDLVRNGITEACRDRTGLTDGVARIIASQLHDGQNSALYSLASTGRIDETLLIQEIGYELLQDQLSGEDRVAARLLGLYVLRHGDRPQVDGWADLWG